MFRSLRFVIFGLAALLALTLSARAATPYDAKAFAAAQAAGKTILVDVFAPWCPVCKRQQSIIQSLQKERPSLVVFRVDYDSAKDVLRTFRVQRQGTLILFKGKDEVGRLIYDADPDRIRALVAKGF
jgi:thiol-disulfide isomerase/thioredoxin